MKKEELIKSAKEEVLGCMIEHQNLGEYKIEDIYGGSDHLIVKLVAPNKERMMAADLIKDKLVDSVVKDNLVNYSDQYLKLLQEEKLEQQRIAQEKLEEEQRIKEAKKKEEAHKRFVESMLVKCNKMKLTLDDYEHMDEEESFLKEHCSVSVAVPTEAVDWFMRSFPDAKPYIVDSSKLTSGGYRYQWSVGAKITIKKSGQNLIPASLVPYVKNNMIQDTQFVLQLVNEYDLKIGR